MGSADPGGPSHVAALAAAAAAGGGGSSAGADGIVGTGLPMSPQRRMRGLNVPSPLSDALAVGPASSYGMMSPARAGAAIGPLTVSSPAAGAAAASAATSALPTTSVTAIIALPGSDLVRRGRSARVMMHSLSGGMMGCAGVHGLR